MESNTLQYSESGHADLISANTYNLVIGLTLLWGFGVNWLMVRHISPAAIAGINPWLFFIGYFASCIFGACLFNASDNPLVSFLGYNFVVVPFGFIINLAVSQYDPALVLNAIKITGLATMLMMILGTVYPGFFRRIGRALFVGLISVIIVESLAIFAFHQHPGIIDWIVVLIFCGYIGFDWGRANSIPRTMDNAVDSAANLYMDIINIFLRVLRILDN